MLLPRPVALAANAYTLEFIYLSDLVTCGTQEKMGWPLNAKQQLRVGLAHCMIQLQAHIAV